MNRVELKSSFWNMFQRVSISPTGSNERNIALYMTEFKTFENLRFQLRMIASIDGQWGSKSENGTWNGMIGMVHRKVFLNTVQIQYVVEETSSLNSYVNRRLTWLWVRYQ